MSRIENETLDTEIITPGSHDADATQTNQASNTVKSAMNAATTTHSEPSRHTLPPEPFEQRLAAVCAAKNPLLEASRVLLRAQADMPEKLESKTLIAQLRVLLEQEIHTFQKLCEQSQIRRDHMIGARYCLCTALDEAAMQTAWGQGRASGIEWITNGLASTFHKDRDGGEKVYSLIGRLLTESKEHLDLLQVIYRILSLGFEGRYRHETNGRRKHDAIRQRLYNEMTAHCTPAARALSPNGQSHARGKRLSLYEFPVWITVSILSLMLLGLFGWYKYQLLNRVGEIRKQIVDIGRVTPIAAPVSTPTRTLHLKALLENEIAAGTVRVDEAARHSTVTFRGDAMFAPGGASVNASMGPLIAKIAAEINKVPGKVSIFGYTDNVPIRSRQFASNQALSEARAAQVMQMLQAAGVAASRLTALGKGEENPIGDNRTAQGRAQNRRVEIVVTQ